MLLVVTGVRSGCGMIMVSPNVLVAIKIIWTYRVSQYKFMFIYDKSTFSGTPRRIKMETALNVFFDLNQTIGHVIVRLMWQVHQTAFNSHKLNFVVIAQQLRMSEMSSAAMSNKINWM